MSQLRVLKFSGKRARKEKRRSTRGTGEDRSRVPLRESGGGGGGADEEEEEEREGEDEHQEAEDKGVVGWKGPRGMVRRDTRNFVIAFQTTLCTPMDSTNQLITVMTRVHQFALIF